MKNIEMQENPKAQVQYPASPYWRQYQVTLNEFPLCMLSYTSTCGSVTETTKKKTIKVNFPLFHGLIRSIIVVV